MSEEPERKKVGWAIRIEFVTAALLLYVLSVGPTYWIEWKLSLPYPTMQAVDATVYRPLWWAADLCQPFQRFLFQYVAFLGSLGQLDFWGSGPSFGSSPAPGTIAACPRSSKQTGRRLLAQRCKPEGFRTLVTREDADVFPTVTDAHTTIERAEKDEERRDKS
jgi:hypothetical protein